MNNDRRKRLRKILDQLGDLQTEIREIHQDEETAYDNLPESLQDGQNGQKMQEAIEAMDDADNEMETVMDSVKRAIGEE